MKFKVCTLCSFTYTCKCYFCHMKKAPYIFFHTELKYVARTALSPTVYVRQNPFQCNFRQCSFFVTLSVGFKYG
jgi:hypothetical protein